MRMPLLALLAGALLAATLPASAATRIYGRISGTPVLDPGSAFDLHLAREDLAVRYADGSGGGDLRLRRIGISFHENVSPAARIGVRLGGVGYSQSDRAVSAGLDPTGYFLELVFAGQWPRRARLGLDLGLSWRYSSVDEIDPDSGSRLGVDWQSLEVRPALRLGLTRAVDARLGVSAVAIDGDERLRNGTARTTGFEEDASTGGFVALDFALAGGDAVTLRARGGNPAGLYVSFEQRY